MKMINHNSRSTNAESKHKKETAFNHLIIFCFAFQLLYRAETHIMPGKYWQYQKKKKKKKQNATNYSRGYQIRIKLDEPKQSHSANIHTLSVRAFRMSKHRYDKLYMTTTSKCKFWLRIDREPNSSVAIYTGKLPTTVIYTYLIL